MWLNDLLLYALRRAISGGEQKQTRREAGTQSAQISWSK